MSIPFLTAFHNVNADADTLPVGMATAHGARTPAFGRALTTYREALGKRHSLQSVAERLRERWGYRTSSSQLFNYERGRPPDIGVLWGLAQIYGVDFTVLCEMVANELSGAAIVAPIPLPTEEGLTIARAYDAGPETLRVVLAGAVELFDQGMRGSGQGSRAVGADDSAAVREGRGQKRKSQRRLRQVG